MKQRVSGVMIKFIFVIARHRRWRDDLFSFNSFQRLLRRCTPRNDNCNKVSKEVTILQGRLHKISFITFVVFFGLFVCFSSSSLAESNEADSLVAEVETKLAAISSLTGSFTQSSYIRDIEETQQYAGTFYIKKPSSIMWEYTSPRDEKIIMKDGTTWIHKKSQNQVIKSRFNKESYNQAPIAMLTGMEKLKDDYDITMPEKNALHLIPKRRIGSVQMIVIETVKGNLPVRTLTIFDTYGNIVIIELTDVTINPELDEALFQFKTPPGAEVYDMSQ